MNNTDKLLRAFIEASGYEIKEVVVDKVIPDLSRVERSTLTIKDVIDYKVTKRDNGVKQFAADVFYRTGDIVPLPIKSKAWGCIVEYVTSHDGDIESDTNDFGTLKPMLDFMNRDSR